MRMSVPAGGSPSVNGSLVPGIGTQSNNMPFGVSTCTVVQFGEFSANCKGTPYKGFIDGLGIFYFISARAAMALGTVSSGRTLYQARMIFPRSSIRNDDRTIPMIFLPYMFFSPQTP